MALEGGGKFTFHHRAGERTSGTPKLVAKKLSVWYPGRERPAVDDISLDIPKGRVTALIGASGSGKTTFLRALNRMNEIVPNTETKGSVEMDGRNIYGETVDPVVVRRKIGMVFQKPNPFAKSIFDNVAYGPRIQGLAKSKKHLAEIVERSLQKAGLWEKVKDRLHQSGEALSGGEQQRLVIARTVAVDPEVILMDEPCSALDPIATAHVEETIDELTERGETIVIVTHSMHQAARVSQKTAFLHSGKLIETGCTEEIFTNPKDSRTQDYITGRFG